MSTAGDIVTTDPVIGDVAFGATTTAALFAITAVLSIGCGLGTKADQLNKTNNDNAIAKTRRFSINFISEDHILICRKMDDISKF